MTDQEIIKEFREEYRKAYAGIFSEEILAQGNGWFESFVLSALARQRQEFRERIEAEDKKWTSASVHHALASLKVAPTKEKGDA